MTPHKQSPKVIIVDSPREKPSVMPDANKQKAQEDLGGPKHKIE
ncbi:MAG: hypothetical protein ACMG6E_04435 [Candidatus Roizmanbacteria bacterium]